MIVNLIALFHVEHIVNEKDLPTNHKNTEKDYRLRLSASADPPEAGRCPPRTDIGTGPVSFSGYVFRLFT